MTDRSPPQDPTAVTRGDHVDANGRCGTGNTFYKRPEALDPQNFTIATRVQSARAATILPQAVDMTPDVILTGAGGHTLRVTT